MLLSKATYSNSHVHSYTNGGGCRPAHQEQFGVHYLAQGHLDMQTRGIEPARLLELFKIMLQSCFTWRLQNCFVDY